MPFSAIGTYACKALQAKLIEFYGQNAAEFRTLGSIGLLKWLRSPQNTRGFRTIDVESIPGKKRAIAMLVDNPFCFEVCSLSGVDCNTARVQTTNPSQEVVFELTSDPYRVCSDGGSGGEPVELSFDADDLMKYCMDDDTTYITRQIARYNKRFIESLDKRVTEIIVTKVGTTSKGAAEQELNFFNTNSTTSQANLNAAAVFFLGQTWKDAGNDGSFALIGGQRVNLIASFKQWQGLNAMGVDLNNINEEIPYIYYDRNFDSVFGNETDFLQVAPGTAQLVTWNRYRGEKRKEVTNLYTHGTFIDPATGIEVDFRWFYDEKCEKWTYEPFLHAELAVNIAGGCSVDVEGADLSGVNGIIKVHDCSTVSADCAST
jgi:hypothetical protein